MNRKRLYTATPSVMRVYGLCVDYQRRNEPITIRKLCQALGGINTQAVHSCLKKLIEAGMIDRGQPPEGVKLLQAAWRVTAKRIDLFPEAFSGTKRKKAAA